MPRILAGSTNVSILVYFVDDVGGTNTGEPTTGLLFSDIETGGSASYVRPGAAQSDFTLITLASASADHADGGFILIDDAKHPGVYRLDLPDAAVARGAEFAVVQLVAASGKNTLMRPIEIGLENKRGYNGIKVKVVDVNGQQDMTFDGGPGDNNGLLDHVVVFENTNFDLSRPILFSSWVGGTKRGTWASDPTFEVFSGDVAYFLPVSPQDDSDTLVSKFHDKILEGNHDIVGSSGAIAQVLRQIAARANNNNLNALVGVDDSSGNNMRKQFFGTAIPSNPVANSVDERIVTLDAVTVEGVALGLLDLANGVETGLTMRQYLRLSAAVLLGKISGMDTDNPKFRDTNNTKDRVVAVTDQFGNRDSVVLDSSD